MAGNGKLANIFAKAKDDAGEGPVEWPLLEYFELCKQDPGYYFPVARRIINGIESVGKPTVVDTSKDPRLSRIYENKKIRDWPAFSKFHGKGVKETIEDVMSFYESAAGGEENLRQILFLYGPPAGAKSALMDTIKDLFQTQPFYTLKAGDEISPINEDPLGLVNANPRIATELKKTLIEEYGVAPRFLEILPSEWAMKRLEEFGGDITKFSVVKRYPSIAKGIAISKTEPGDDSTQDTGTLVGKLNIKATEDYKQDDPDAYLYSGALNKGNNGIVEFPELFKAPIKSLTPLLEATQARGYRGVESGSIIPFSGTIAAHTNMNEWNKVIGDKKNEAYLSRMHSVEAPYVLEWSDEVEVYKENMKRSVLSDLPIAPQTLEMLAQWVVMTRIDDPKSGSVYEKMRVYNGENLKATNPGAKTIREYRGDSSGNEGLSGIDPRFAFKTLSAAFNMASSQSGERAASPYYLVKALRQRIKKLKLGDKEEARYMNLLDEHLVPRYKAYIQQEVEDAYLESHSDYGQHAFDRYISYAESWLRNEDGITPEGGVMDRKSLEVQLEKIEKAAGISNPKDFRQEVVFFVYGARQRNGGKNPDWKSYEKMKDVIQKQVKVSMEQLAPVISFAPGKGEDDQRRHNVYVDSMKKRGYTENQIRVVTDICMNRMQM